MCDYRHIFHMPGRTSIKNNFITMVDMTLSKLSGAAPTNASILVILMGSLGDLVRGLCLPGEIKRHWPGSTITWLVEPSYKSLVDYHPLIDNVIVFDRPRGRAAVFDLRREMKQRHFDITLDLQRHFKSGVFSFLSRAPQRIGVHPRNAKEFNWVFNNHHIPYFSDQQPKLDHYLKFVAYMGATPSDRPDFGLSSLDASRLPERLAAQLPNAFIVVVMGSSWISKDWTYDGYRELLERILRRGTHGAVLVGDGSQAGPAGQLEKAMKSDRLVNFAGRTSLLELTAILKRAAVSVGPDSGPGHISAAVGTPYVALFGPTNPDRVAPFRCDRFVVQADSDCHGCYRKACRYTGPNCMAEITADMVVPKLEQALSFGKFF
jgi:ADP-heptose:LPS heptosyltransferase